MFRVLVLVGALLAGGLAAWLSFGLQPGATPAAMIAAAPEVKTEDVLVAAVDLPQGASVTDKELRWQAWPQDAANPAFISRALRPEAITELTGSVVRQAMVVGEPVRDVKLSNKDSGYLATLLKPGMRAVAVRVTAESSAGGFILPNDHVDVLHAGNTDGGRSRTLLSNIRVLAIDQRAVDSDTESDSAVGKTATLELDPAQAEIVSGAQANGSLSLALRATVDNDEKPAPAAVRRSTGISVRIVRAGQIQTIQSDGAVQ